jgi:hypothetical protein
MFCPELETCHRDFLPHDILDFLFTWKVSDQSPYSGGRNHEHQRAHTRPPHRTFYTGTRLCPAIFYLLTTKLFIVCFLHKNKVFLRAGTLIFLLISQDPEYSWCTVGAQEMFVKRMNKVEAS